MSSLLNFSELDIKGNESRFKEYYLLHRDSILNKKKKLVDVFPPFDFDKLGYDNFSKQCLKAMHIACKDNEISQLPDRDNSNYYKMENTLLNHPAVDACDHTGSSFFWTYTVLRQMYADNWETWIEKYIKSRCSDL